MNIDFEVGLHLEEKLAEAAQERLLESEYDSKGGIGDTLYMNYHN